MSKCGAICEVFSRVCGYFRPVTNWNKGKQEESGWQIARWCVMSAAE